ncbi:MAG: NAD(P)-dependent alcohol dehydrogenase [Gammaproteobacteria bacterium]|nr:NAD(P)-dependent alcohol dehydrogenase [Gammaproteobacteria bacterium]MBQ0839046.1 NAD(P)-dependent alcohol dehydrogenase [Gammaproteobacteria bacterium]
MKAIVFDNYGPPEVLYVEEVPTPVPQPNEILIRVRAAEATKSDCEMRKSKGPIKWVWPYLRIATGILRPSRGRILGWYFAGEVESVGAKVTHFKPGDRVFGCTKLRFGAYGEYVTLPESYTVALMPEDMSFEDAAAVPLGGLNALHFLRRAKIKPHESILVIGAGGSIGMFTVMIAKSLGAKITVVDKAEKLPMLFKIGADEAIDYQREDYWAIDKRFDVVFSTVAHSVYDKALSVLNPGGRYIVANPRLADLVRSIFTSSFTDKRSIVALALEKQEELETLKSMLELGTIQSIVGHVFPMREAAKAHHLVESEGRRGAVVLQMYPP